MSWNMACTLTPDEFPKACRYKGKNGEMQEPLWMDGADLISLYPSYNIAPKSYITVLLSSQHFNDTASETMPERVLQSMRWGLIPPWCNGDTSNLEHKLNTARSETLLQKKSYGTPLLEGKRCAIIVDGFFRWIKTQKDGKSQRYYVHFKNDAKMGGKEEETSVLEDKKNKVQESLSQPFNSEDVPALSHVSYGNRRLLYMAGLFECCPLVRKVQDLEAEEENELFSCSVITVDASPSQKWMCNRIPAILDGEEEVRQWLDYGDVPLEKARKLLKPKDCLEWYPVANKFYKNNSPESIQPIALAKEQERPQTRTLDWYFKKTRKRKEEISSESEPAPKKRKASETTAGPSTSVADTRFREPDED